jgi:hypothetical protein
LIAQEKAGIIKPGRPVVVRPKLPWPDLQRLLEPGEPTISTAVSTSDDFPAQLAEFLATRFVHLAQEQAARGWPVGYAERGEAGGFVRGRIDVAESLRRSSTSRT